MEDPLTLTLPHEGGGDQTGPRQRDLTPPSLSATVPPPSRTGGGRSPRALAAHPEPRRAPLAMEAAYAQRYRALWDGHWWWRSREALLPAEIGRIGRATPPRRILD